MRSVIPNCIDDEIRENDYNLNIRRYADISLPPEQFDVKAVLVGCLSQKLRMSTSNPSGMDVSCVFVRRDDGITTSKSK